jgi:hypothetical protein
MTVATKTQFIGGLNANDPRVSQESLQKEKNKANNNKIPLTEHEKLLARKRYANKKARAKKSLAAA